MCGIVGYIGEWKLPYEKAFKELLFIDTLRGSHSTGVLTVNPKSEWEYRKSVGDATDFLDRKATDKLFSGQHKILLGHNRYATSGTVSNATAHPFKCGKVIGVHNGTLKYRHQLPATKVQDFSVDSEQLLASIDRAGVEAAYAQLEGAAAVVWFDTDTDELKILRNAERTLFYARTADSKTLFFASEAWMLYGILYRNAIDHSKVKMFPIDTLVVLSYDGKELTDKRQKLVPFIPAPYVPPPAYGRGDNLLPFAKTSATETKAGANSTTATTRNNFNRNSYHIFSPNKINNILNSKNIRTGQYVSGPIDGHPDKIARVYVHADSVSDVDLLACVRDRRRLRGKVASIVTTMDKVDEYIIGNSSVRMVLGPLDPPPKTSIIGHNSTRLCLGAERLTRLEFAEKYAECAHCGKDHSFEDNLIMFLSDDTGVCGDCATDPNIRDTIPNQL